VVEDIFIENSSLRTLFIDETIDLFLWTHDLHIPTIRIMIQEGHILLLSMIPDETIHLNRRGILMIIIEVMIQEIYPHPQWTRGDPTIEDPLLEDHLLLNTEDLIVKEIHERVLHHLEIVREIPEMCENRVMIRAMISASRHLFHDTMKVFIFHDC
jgi:hypothetical protein